MIETITRPDLPDSAKLGMSKKPNAVDKGMDKGEAYSERLMGLSTGEFAPMFSDILSKRQQAANGQDPASSLIRQTAGNEVRAARMGGTKLSPEQEMQARRNADYQAQTTLYKTQQQGLDKYQSLVGNLAAQNQANVMGFASLEQGLAMPAAPEAGGISVICTQLYQTGLMTRDMYVMEQVYGHYLINFHPEVYVGYRTWADCVVKGMQKSAKFNKFVSIFALSWAGYVHTGKGFFGKVIHKLGYPICNLIGHLVTLIRGEEICLN